MALPLRKSGPIETPLEHFERERERGLQHGRYVGLLLQHALAAIRLLEPGERNRWRFGPWSVSVEEGADDWVLRLDQGIAEKQALVDKMDVRVHYSIIRIECMRVCACVHVCVLMTACMFVLNVLSG